MLIYLLSKRACDTPAKKDVNERVSTKHRFPESLMSIIIPDPIYLCNT